MDVANKERIKSASAHVAAALTLLPSAIMSPRTTLAMTVVHNPLYHSP